jgi:hypothetical protein
MAQRLKRKSCGAFSVFSGDGCPSSAVIHATANNSPRGRTILFPPLLRVRMMKTGGKRRESNSRVSGHMPC